VGLYANTQIWLGAKVSDRRELGELLRDLSEEVYQQLEDCDEINFVDLKFRRFNHAEEPVGFGIELLDQGWREGPQELNLSSLAEKVQELMPKIKSAFIALGIKAEPKIWIATNLR